MLSNVPVECPGALLAKAKRAGPIAVAIADAGSPLVMSSARLAWNEGILTPVFVGDAVAIRKTAAEIGWNIADFRSVTADGEAGAAATSVALARSREVDAIMKGDVHTDVLLRAVLNRDAGLRDGKFLSHVFHMTLPGSDNALCITDAVLNVLPSLEQKRGIARNAIALLHGIGYAEPRVAVLSATEASSAAMPSSLDAAALAGEAGEGAFAGAVVDGPLAFDLAVSREAARIKGVDRPVAGNTDVLLVPNIETGNALFKMMVHFMSAAAAGIVLGAKVPVLLTSRADPAAARLASVALAAAYLQPTAHAK